MPSSHTGPTWREVITGALMSVVLGAVLGLLHLVFKPVKVVSALPAEADRKADTLYVVEGSHDPLKARQALAKRKLFAQGGSVTMTEDEINYLISPPLPANAKGAAKPKVDADPTAAAPPPSLAVSPPNFHLHEGRVQILVPVKVSAFGVDDTVSVVADGTFVKDGSIFVFSPSSLMVGSCPVSQIPYLDSLTFKKFFGEQPVPEDLANSWAKLTDVSVDGNALTLAMP